MQLCNPGFRIGSLRAWAANFCPSAVLPRDCGIDAFTMGCVSSVRIWVPLRLVDYAPMMSSKGSIQIIPYSYMLRPRMNWRPAVAKIRRDWDERNVLHYPIARLPSVQPQRGQNGTSRFQLAHAAVSMRRAACAFGP